MFTLKFPSEPDRDLFFWAQEPQADSDTQFVNAVNAALTSVLDGEITAFQIDPYSLCLLADALTNCCCLISKPTPIPILLPGMDADTDVAMSEDPRDPSATPAAGAPPPTSDNIGGIGASALAAALGNILTGGTSGTGPSQGIPQLSYPSLGEVLKADRIAPLLQNPSLVARLAPYLPEEHRSTEAMAQIIHSPQFKHQLEVLTQALATGQIDTSQFGLGPPAFGVAEFLKAIQRQADQEGAASRDAEETEKKDEGQ